MTGKSKVLLRVIIYRATLREDRLETPRVVSAGPVQKGNFSKSDDEASISQRLHSWDT